MPQSYDFIFISARDFGKKLQKKLGSYALYQGKICVICEICVTYSLSHRFHRFTQILGLDLKSRR